MDSDLHHGHQHYHHHQHQQQQQQQQVNSGLTRYRSAPSSYFANLMNSVNFGEEDGDEVFNPRVSSPETDRILQRFVSSVGGSSDQNSNAQNPQQSLCQIRTNDSSVQPQFVGSMKHEQEDLPSHHHHQQQLPQQQQQMIYQTQSQPGHNSVVASTSAGDDAFIAASSMAIDRLPSMKMGGNLIRQSSSPAGFFSHVNVDNGYSVMRGMRNFGTGSEGTRAELSFPSAKRFQSQIDFSSGPPSSSGLLARIPEIDGKSMEISNPEEGTFDETQRKDEVYVSGFGSGSWDDSSILSDNFLKGLEDSNRHPFPNLDLSESQNDEGRSRPPTTLTHHLSLPTSSAELSAMEKLMQFQDSVPLRIRAKRGCATHPRSIAERVRRTRISERMRKLQELVPNMDKQTNTADMLDLAVDYIKDLQKQVEVKTCVRQFYDLNSTGDNFCPCPFVRPLKNGYGHT